MPLVPSIPVLYRDLIYCEISSESVGSSVEPAQTDILVLPSTIYIPNFPLETYSTDFDLREVGPVCEMLDSQFHDGHVDEGTVLASQIPDHCGLLELPYKNHKTTNI